MPRNTIDLKHGLGSWSWQPSARPPAIVIGLDCITGLQTARILAARGVPVLGLARDRDHPSCRTRACQQILLADTHGPGLVTALQQLAEHLARLSPGQRAVLVPCTDPGVATISASREVLERWYPIPLPQADTVAMLMDKQRFHAFAVAAGLPVPDTRLLDGRDAAQQAARSMPFPCVLKPTVKTPRWESQTKEKAIKVNSGAELLQWYDRCADWTDALLVQEWIAGTDANLYSCNCYLDAHSRPLVTFTARKLRQWPPEAGTSCLGEEVRSDVVLQETVRLFQAAGFRGLGYVEMKLDARTGRWLIIEPNVGRPTGRSAIAEAGGVELLYTMYCDCVGAPLPENRQQTYQGVKWIYWRRDLQSAYHYWRRGELTLWQWWQSCRGRKGHADFSWTDPAPFVADFVRAWRRRARPRLSVANVPVPPTAPDVTSVPEPAAGVPVGGARAH